MATISIQLPDGSTKTIKKDLGHEYDYRIDDAKKDIENILDKKGIKKYSIHLDRYKDNSAYLDRDAMSKSQAPDNRAKTDYVDNKPYQPKDGKGDYMDKTPYKASPTKVNYLDKAKSGEFRDMANYESIEEMDRRGFLKAMGGAALAGAGLSAADAAAQQMDTMARVIMIVNGEQVERVINLGQVSSPQAAERALANELQARGIEQFQISLERGAPPKTAPVDTRPRPYGARSVAGPGGVVDTAGQVVGDVNSGDWRGAAQKGWKTYQNNKNADMGAVGRAEVKDRIIRGVVGGLGLDEDDLNEHLEKHLYQLQSAGYDIVTEAASLCPECGGAAYEDRILAEKQDACYHKVKSRYKVWPSAYASGALVKCRKKGAANWGNKSKK
jgi:L-rhamnose mutarotase